MKNYKKTTTQHTLSPVFRACMTLTVVMGGIVSQSAFAGAGWGDSNGPNAGPIRVPTYYAGSPSGKRANIPTDSTAGPAANNNGGNTGAALRKFVDPLPGFGASTNKLTDGVTSKYIPIAQPEKWVDGNGLTTNDDYYEIAAVEYTEKLHSDLKKPTTLRGYVQLVTPGLTAKGVVGTPFVTLDGQTIQVVDVPHYLGPVINATKGVPTRLKFVNMLPVGRLNGATRNGDLFIPVDETLAGSGYGPDGLFRYTQNRANVHLHGGDNPWISDGAPHTWITPAGEANPALAGSLAQQGADAATYLRGVSAKNVPDMPNPGPGAQTYYFPNGQTARMMWYHDHTLGLTRLNVYAGMVAPYILKDATEDALITAGVLPDASATIPLIIQDKTFVPDDIALQDAKWNKDVAGADVALWGTPGDLWFPHVYEFNQDPNNGLDGTSPPGRWDWGPYFWPVFPALYNVPTGAVGDVTTTPEAFMDTPLVNGVAYPKLDVEAKPYRFKILNASNDRFLNLGLYVADSAVSTINVTTGGLGYVSPVVTITAATGDTGSGASATAIVQTGVVIGVRVDNAGTGYNLPPTITITEGTNASAVAVATVALNTEVKMVPAAPIASQSLPACATDAKGVDIAAPYAPACWPATWPADGRDGGVPDPAQAGPKLYQIGNETGLLPQVAEIASTPMGYEFNRRSITVLNAFTYGLFMGTAERADVVVDFSQFAGKTLILYNDSPAPVPAFDPRIDYYTGSPDQTGAGGNEGTNAGFGPNTRTIMQIKVSATGTPVPLNAAALTAAIPAAYAASGKEPPIVAQSAYNAAFNATWSDAPKPDGTKAYANIFTGSQQEPIFKFTPGDGSAGVTINVVDGGSGYTVAPAVTFTGTGTGAAGVATLRMSNVTILSGGSGYQVAPTVTFAAPPVGLGDPATGHATLKVGTIAVTNGGSGYLAATPPTVLFSDPSTPAPAGRKATGVAIVNASGAVTGITITDAGAGYSVRPNILVAAPTSGTRATAVVNAQVAGITLTSPNPNRPNLAGGSGYASFAANAVTIAAPPAGGTRATASVTGAVAAINITNHGTGYTSPFTVAVTGNASVAVSTNGALAPKNKAIQELFDPTYGRMNATLGVELPFTSALTQTTIPLGYIDPPTEALNDGETTLWKITHNGVDVHPVHFHLVNVQLINRIGWDGTVKPPMPNELGWKETVKMNPLEDIVVAMRAKKPVLPGFGLPNSIRPMDPSQPLGVPYGFTQVNPLTGNPATVLNAMQDYGWEYVWHCHILGHEENDFMRPIIFNANEAIPTAPSNLTAATGGGGNFLQWTDNATTEYQYTVSRAPLDLNNIIAGPYVDITANNPLLANANKYFDLGLGVGFSYKVAAVGAAGTTESVAANINNIVTVPTAPANLLATAGASSISLQWTDASNNELGFLLERSPTGANIWTTVGTNVVIAGSLHYSVAANTAAFIDAGLTQNTAYDYRISSVNSAGASSAAVTSATTLFAAAPAVIGLIAAPSTPVPTVPQAAYPVILNWTAPAAGSFITGFVVTRTGGGAPVTVPLAANATSYADASAQQATAYTYTVNAVNGVNNGVTNAGPTATAALTTPYALAPAIAGLSGSSTGLNQITLNWNLATTPVTSYVVNRCVETVLNVNCTAANSVWVALAPQTSLSTYIDNAVAPNTAYAYRINSVNGVGAGATTGAVSSLGVADLTVSSPTGLTAIPTSSTRVVLTWTDVSTNESGYTIERSTDGVTFTQIGVTGAGTGVRTFNDNNGTVFNTVTNTLVAGTTYTYRVRAQNTTRAVTTYSAYSNAATASFTLPAAPTVVAAVQGAVGSGQIIVNWTDNSNNETGFTVQRSLLAANGLTWGNPVNAGTVAAGTTSFTDIGLTIGRTYRYQVRANGAVGNTLFVGPSNAVVAP